MNRPRISSLPKGSVLVVPMMCLTIAACSDGTGPGSGNGRVQAVMHDNPGAAVVAAAPAASYSVAAAAASAFSGSMSAVTSVAIAAEGGAWIDLGAPRQISVNLQSTRDTAEVEGQASVPVGTYARVRVTMRQASTVVLSGSILGGVTVSGNISITMNGGSDVVIEKEITPFRVEASTQTQISMDLNSEAWMTAETAQSRAVSKAQIESAMAVTARSRTQATF